MIVIIPPAYVSSRGSYSGTFNQAVINSLQLVLALSAPSATLTSIAEAGAYLYTATAPTTTLVTPTGTLNTTYPLIGWTYTQADGYAQTSYRVTITASGTTYADSGVVTSSANQWRSPTTLAAGTYTANVTTYLTISGQTLASTVATNTFTIPALPPTPTVSSVFNADGSVLVTAVAATNMLSSAQSTFDFGFIDTGWTATNATPTTTTAQAQSGTYSVSLAATSTSMVWTGPLIPVTTDGRAMSASAYTRAAVTSRTPTIALQWIKADGTTIDVTNTGTGVANSTAAWTQITVSATKSANAVYVRPVITFPTTVAAEVQYVDTILLNPGAGTTWTPAGLWSTTVFTIQRSLDAGTTWTSLTDPTQTYSTIPTPVIDGNLTAVYADLGLGSNVAAQYRALVTVVDAYNYNSTSAASTVTSGTTPVLTGWYVRPLSSSLPGTSVNVMNWAPRSLNEQSTTFQIVGGRPYVVTNKGFSNTGQFDLDAYTTTDKNNAVALAALTVPFWLLSPYGWTRLVRSTNVQVQEYGPSGAPRYKYTFQYVEL